MSGRTLRLLHEWNQGHESCTLYSECDLLLSLNRYTGVVTWNDLAPLRDELLYQPEVLVVAEAKDLVGICIFSILVRCHRNEISDVLKRVLRDSLSESKIDIKFVERWLIS